MMGAEVIIAIGTAISATLGAIFGGKNSLNGFKTEVKNRFDGIDVRFDKTDAKLESLIVSDALQDEREERLDVRVTRLEDDPHEEPQ